MTLPAVNQQTVEALAETIHESHAKAMEALAADVHPYSAEAIRDHEEALAAALRDLVAQADAPVAEIRRLLDAYYGDNPESMEVAVAAQKIEAWLDGVAAGKEGEA